MSKFVYITDLPPQVREVLDVALQQTWLDIFNAVMTLSGNETEAYQTAWLKAFQAAFPGEITTDDVPQMVPLSESDAKTDSYGYWIDLAGLQFSDDETVTWLQAMPHGTYHHPRHGRIDFTPERSARFAHNVNTSVLGIDPDIDYDHKALTTEAAGWVKKAEARPDGLWLAVEWTKGALTKLKEKAYRYFSPEYVDDWEHPKTRQKFKDVLRGGALTNRPFIKDILPINLSEVIPNQGGHLVDPKKLRKLLGLAEDATDDQVTAEMDKRLTAGPDTTQTTPDQTTTTTDTTATTPANETTQKPETTTTTTPATIAANDVMAQAIKLAEDSPVVKSLLDRLTVVETGARMDSITKRLSDMTTEGNRVLTPAAADAIKELCKSQPVQLSDSILDLVEKILKDGTVELGERGGSNGNRTTTTGNDADPVKRFTDAVEKAQKDNDKLSFADAAEIVARDEPKLFTDYQRASYVREEV